MPAEWLLRATVAFRANQITRGWVREGDRRALTPPEHLHWCHLVSRIDSSDMPRVWEALPILFDDRSSQLIRDGIYRADRVVQASRRLQPCELRWRLLGALKMRGYIARVGAIVLRELVRNARGICFDPEESEAIRRLFNLVSADGLGDRWQDACQHDQRNRLTDALDRAGLGDV